MQKIGYLETYDSKSGMIEKSSDRLKSLISLVMAFIIVIGQFVWGDGFDSWGFVAIVLIFLINSATPKALKDIAAIKNLVGVTKSKPNGTTKSLK
jgi:hypothetical protein